MTPENPGLARTELDDEQWRHLQELKAADLYALMGHKDRRGEKAPVNGNRCECGCNQPLGYREDVIGIGGKIIIAGHQRE